MSSRDILAIKESAVGSDLHMRATGRALSGAEERGVRLALRLNRVTQSK